MRFHLDEHIPTAIAVGLRAHGVDVTTTSDANLQGVPDDQQLAYAQREGRVLVTHDHGIAYCHQDKHQIGGLLGRLLLLHETCLHDSALAGRVEYL